MRCGTLIPTIALLLLKSHDVHAINGWPFYSSGEMDLCPRYGLTNATSFNASYMYSNDTLAFELSGLRTTSGSAGLSIALIADGGKDFLVSLDPCTMGIAELCPASEGVVGIPYTNWTVPTGLAMALDLAHRTDVTFQLGLNIYGADQRLRSSCVKTVLRSGDGGDSGNENPDLGGNSSSNTTVGNGGNGSARPDENDSNNATIGDSGSDATDTTSNGNTDSPDDTTRDSGAGTLKAVWHSSLCIMAIWLL